MTTTKALPTFVTCPGKSCGVTTCGETVEAFGFRDFDATTVEVMPCSKLVAQGWTGPQLIEYKSRAGYLLPAAPTAFWQHMEGLVWFST